MDGIRQYVLSVICVVILCGITELFITDGKIKALVKVVSGLTVTLTVLNPFVRGYELQWGLAVDEILKDREAAIADGECTAQESYCEIITDQTQAYILDKASSLGVEVKVEIELKEEYPNAPNLVRIHGPISPYEKRQLSAYMQQYLGIDEDKQIWI